MPKTYAPIALLRRFLMTRVEVRGGRQADPFPQEYQEPAIAEAKMLDWVNRDVTRHAEALEEVRQLKELMQDGDLNVRRWVNQRESEVAEAYYLRNLQEQELRIDKLMHKIALVALTVWLLFITIAFEDTEDMRRQGRRAGGGNRPVARQVVRVRLGVRIGLRRTIAA